MINYSILTSGAYLTSQTNAAFIDTITIHGSIETGNWEEKQKVWDKSSLKFPGEVGLEGSQVFAIIKNTGSDMQDFVNYEVYWITNGNPKKGEIVEQGMVPLLKTGETIKLYHNPEKVGIYKFKAYQHAGHSGKGELWSDSITVELSMLQAQVVMSEIIATDADLEAVAKGIITQKDLDAFLNGEITREDLDALIDENSKLEEELLPEEQIRKEEELEDENIIAPGLSGGGGGAAIPPKDDEDELQGDSPEDPIDSDDEQSVDEPSVEDENEEQDGDETSVNDDAKDISTDDTSSDTVDGQEEFQESDSIVNEEAFPEDGLEETDNNDDNIEESDEEQEDNYNIGNDHLDEESIDEDLDGEESSDGESADDSSDGDSDEVSEDSTDSTTAMIQTLVHALT